MNSFSLIGVFCIAKVLLYTHSFPIFKVFFLLLSMLSLQALKLRYLLPHAMFFLCKYHLYTTKFAYMKCVFLESVIVSIISIPTKWMALMHVISTSVMKAIVNFFCMSWLEINKTTRVFLELFV